MATNFSDFTLEGIKNPLKLQGLVLDKFTESTDGQFSMTDGNNVTSFLIEGFSSIASKAIQKIDDTVLPAIYPSRAQSVGDLYKHLSDYDYLGLFAAPATCSIILIVDKDYLMNYAIDVTDSKGQTQYRKVVIPKTTRFTIGSYTFGLYYPIEIRVSTQTGMFTVMYDTTETNPLHVLSQNILEYSFRRHDEMTLAYIKIPVYQFNTDVTEEPLITGSGYRRVISYSNQFYALRCTADVMDPATEEWSNQELSLALSGRTYNPEKPTVVFTVDPSNQQLILEIPYIYFTRGLLRGNLRVEVYTTAGYLNYQIPTNTDELVGINMFGIPLDESVQKYTEPFREMPALGAVPVTMKIIGGTDGMSYSELRRKVVTDAFGDVTLQTPADVDAYFANEGYVTSLFKDGITDRIFNAHVVLRDDNDAIVAAASVNTLIDLATLTKNNPKTIVQADADVYTILPSTRYRFDVDQGICVPLTDIELDTLNQLSAAERVKAFNNNIYTLSPFHIQVSIKDTYPTTATYDMTDIEVISREFLTARDVAQHMSLNSVDMTVIPVDSATDDENHVTDMYRLVFNVIKSGLDGYDAVITTGDQMGHRKLRVIVGLKKLDGSYIFADADYSGTENSVDQFAMQISSTATFSQTDGGHSVRIKSPFSDAGVDVLLTTEARVIFCISREVENIKNNYRTDKHQDKFLETDYTESGLEDIGSYYALSEYRVNLRFGKLVNELDQRISLVYSGHNYKKYDTTSFRTIETPIYETNEYGVPTYTVVGGKVVLDMKYPVGTLTCFTNYLEESVVVSEYLASNLVGCRYKTQNEPAFDDGKRFTEANITTWRGWQYAVEAHVVPRFKITAAKLFQSGESPILGSYELANANDTSRGCLSTSADAWYNVYIKNQEARTYEVKAVDALKYVVENFFLTSTGALDTSGAHIVSGENRDDNGVLDATNPYKADPLSQITNYVDGMFIAVTNDATNNDPKVDFTNGSLSGYPTKIYYRKNDKWNCVLAVNSMSALVEMVNDDSVGYTRPPEGSKFEMGQKYYKIESGSASLLSGASASGSGVDYVYGATIGNEDTTNVWVYTGSVHGYAYVISRVPSNIGGASVALDPNGKILNYVAFLSVDSNGIPDFTRKEEHQMKDNGTTNDSNGAWKDKWPWDVEEWYRLSTNVIDGKKVCEKDSEFTAELDYTRLSGYCHYVSGQVKLNTNGVPEEDTDTPREVKYLINMLQVDAKLAETTTAKATHAYPNSLIETMRTHFNNLGSVKNRLYTSTKLYFEPMKSLGFGSFYTDGTTVQEHELDVRMKFRLHVSSDIADSEDMRDSMRESIIKLIDDHMAAGSTNMAAIAQLILDNNSDSVRYVDVLGIDGDENLQTMRCVDSEVRPHLKHELKLLDDGVTIDLTRGLDLEFVVADV